MTPSTLRSSTMRSESTSPSAVPWVLQSRTPAPFLAGDRLDAGDDPVVDAVLKGGDEQGDRVGAAEVEPAREPVGGVVELLHDREHMLAGFRLDLFGVIEHP